MVLLEGGLGSRTLYFVKRIKGFTIPSRTIGKEELCRCTRDDTYKSEHSCNAPLIQRTDSPASMAFNSNTVLINQ